MVDRTVARFEQHISELGAQLKRLAGSDPSPASQSRRDALLLGIAEYQALIRDCRRQLAEHVTSRWTAEEISTAREVARETLVDPSGRRPLGNTAHPPS
jgi:hypothetical protein